MSAFFDIRRYEEKDSMKWDDFIRNDSVNGTFLQSRRFLSYHPCDRFKDNSYILFDEKGNIAAVCPACVIQSEKGRFLSAHSGSTYGGIVIRNKYYSAQGVIRIINTVEDMLRKEQFDGVTYKITPSIFSKEPADLLEYCLYYSGYQEYDELNLYIDYADYKENITSNYDQGKRTHVNNCIRAGMALRELYTDDEIRLFYSLLRDTLAKYDLKPVHSVEELLDFKNVRLREECSFYGAFLNDELVAGAMMFVFDTVNVAHSQYISATHDYDKLSPMTFMYHAMIEEMKRRGFAKLSFGISSEHTGKVLNYGLTASKESYGSKHSVNRIFYKNF